MKREYDFSKSKKNSYAQKLKKQIILDFENNKKEIPEKITSVEQLFGTLPSDITLDDIRTERLLK